MADIEFPNYLNTFVASADAGHQMAAQRARQNALAMIGTDPQGAQNALMQAGDFQDAEAIGQVSARQAQTAARTSAAAQYAKGDTKGAISMAMTADPALAEAYVKLDDHTQAVMKDVTARRGAIAFHLAQDFQKDPVSAAQQWETVIKPDMMRQQLLTQADLANMPDPHANPKGFIGWLDHSSASSMTAVEQMNQLDKDRTFGETQQHDRATEGQQAAQLQETVHHNRADEGNASAKLAEDRRHNKASEGDGTSPLTPESVEQIAQQIDAGAPMPNFGMGKAALAARTQVLNRVAEIRGGRGATGYDAAGQGASYKANSAALSKVTTQRSMIEGFEGTARQNGQQVRDVLTKGAGPGTAWFNRPIQALRQNALGDANVTALNTAIQVYTGEVAKIVSGSTGSQGSTDAMRRETATMLDPNSTPAQILRSMDILDKDMANRTGSLRNQERQIRSTITANPNTPPPPAAPAGGARPPLASFQQ